MHEENIALWYDKLVSLRMEWKFKSCYDISLKMNAGNMKEYRAYDLERGRTLRTFLKLETLVVPCSPVLFIIIYW